MRVIIDTNLWISFLIGKSLAGLTDALIANRITVLFSEQLFAELIEVLRRPKFKKYFSEAAIEELIALLFILMPAGIAKTIFFWIWRFQAEPII